MVLSESEAENNGGLNASEAANMCSDRAYPIHLACANEHCPNSVVELLARSNPYALGHLCILKDYGLYSDCDDEHVGGVPLHYYFSRTSNMELDTVKVLIEAYPNSLTTSGEEVPCFPAHVLIDNPEVGTFCDIVQHLIELHPSSLQCTDTYDQVPLHVACYSKHMTANIVQLLVDGWPESTCQKDCNGSSPIHNLCENQELNETVKLDILRILVDACPDSLKARNQSYLLPIHFTNTMSCLL